VGEEGLLPREIEGASAEVVKEEDRSHFVNVHPAVEERKTDVSCFIKSKDKGWFMRDGAFVADVPKYERWIEKESSSSRVALLRKYGHLDCFSFLFSECLS
jgi:hypothetical protein